jgi:hypothetical protein
MKPLTNEQKEKMWKQIEKALHNSSEPEEGEYTLAYLMEITGFNRNRMLSRLTKLIDAEIIGVRKGIADGSYCNIYFPLKEASLEEIVAVLIE